MSPRTTTRPTRRSERRSSHAVERARPVSGEQRSREEGGPRDLAFYACDCGHGFEGAVSTHVACPQCGSDQDW